MPATSNRSYTYVGPADIRESALSTTPPGTPIRTTDELVAWIQSHRSELSDEGLVATFTISLDHVLHLAPRRSEHVACASGGPVLSAGEVIFSLDGELLEISNQSTGFCPEPESWAAVELALAALPLEGPEAFTTAITFRLCPACNERNIVKDAWFVCDLCGAKLPTVWNF